MPERSFQRSFSGAWAIAVALIAFMIWRAPAVVIHPTGAIFMADIRYFFENAFTWSVILVMVWFVCTKVNLWMGLFLGLAAFSAWYPINTSISELTFKFVLSGVIWYSICVHYMNTEKGIKIILNTLCVIILLNCALIISQGIFNYDPLHVGLKPYHASVKFDPTPNVGFMSCFNGASALLAICLPLFFNKKWYRFIPLILVCLVYTHTFGGPLGIAVAVLIFGLIFLKERWQKLSIILILLVALFGYVKFVDNPDTSWRYKVWKSALTKTMPQKPWFGSGLGHWKLHYTRMDITKHSLDQAFFQAHNEPLQARYEMGFFAGIIILGYLVMTFHKGIKRLLIKYDHYLFMGLMSIVVIVVTSSVFFTFHIPIIAGAALTIMAMVQARLNEAV